MRRKEEKKEKERGEEREGKVVRMRKYYDEEDRLLHKRVARQK